MKYIGLNINLTILKDVNLVCVLLSMKLKLLLLSIIRL